MYIGLKRGSVIMDFNNYYQAFSAEALFYFISSDIYEANGVTEGV